MNEKKEVMLKLKEEWKQEQEKLYLENPDIKVFIKRRTSLLWAIFILGIIYRIIGIFFFFGSSPGIVILGIFLAVGMFAGYCMLVHYGRWKYSFFLLLPLYQLSKDIISWAPAFIGEGFFIPILYPIFILEVFLIFLLFFTLLFLTLSEKNRIYANTFYDIYKKYREKVKAIRKSNSL